MTVQGSSAIMRLFMPASVRGSCARATPAASTASPCRWDARIGRGVVEQVAGERRDRAGRADSATCPASRSPRRSRARRTDRHVTSRSATRPAPRVRGNGFVHEAAGRHVALGKWTSGVAGDAHMQREDRQGRGLRIVHGCRPPGDAHAGQRARSCAATAEADAPRSAARSLALAACAASDGRSPGSRIRRGPPAFPGVVPVACRQAALRLQLRGQPRRRTAFPFHLPHGRTIAATCMPDA